jgi:hypothetical protein
LGLVIVISDNKDISVTQEKPNYLVHTFSFHDANNARVMHQIASSSGGIFAILDDQDYKITEAFMSCINNFTSIIAVNTTVKLCCNSSYRLKLSTKKSGKFNFTINNDKKHGFICAGALYGGAERRFIVYVENVLEDDYDNLSKMLTVDVTWQHAFSPVHTSQCSAAVEIIRDKNNKSSREVVVEIARNEVITIVSEIDYSKTEAQYFESITQKLKNIYKSLRVQDDGVDVLMRRKPFIYTFGINEEIPARLANDRDGFWQSYIISWLSFQESCEKPPLAPSMPRQKKTVEKDQGDGTQKQDKLD